MTLPASEEPYIGYIRVSTWKEEKISPEIQRTAILEWARRTGRRIVDWVEDLDESGRHFKRKIMRAIERVERGEARGIAVWRYSRFGRDRTGNALSLARLESVGGRLESATEPVDASTAIGRFQRGMILEFGAFESDRAGEQWRETHAHRRARKLPATGRPRFGYIWHPRVDRITQQVQNEWYEPDPETGPVVAELYRRYVAGTGFASLCGWLNERGYRTTRGALWTAPTLTRYMDSGFPAGLLRIHDPSCHCAARTGNGFCRNYYLTVGAHEELIGPDLWDAYQRRRKQVRDTPPRARQVTYELTGLTKCGTCRGGTSLTTGIRGGVTISGYAYRCSQRLRSGGTRCTGVWIPRADVEQYVHTWLAQHAPGIDGAPPTPMPGQTDPEAERARAARERARLRAEQQKLDDALKRLVVDAAMHPDKYPPGAFEAARDELTRRRDQVLAALAEVDQAAEQPTLADYQPLVVGLLDEWPTLLVVERNALLRQLVRRVVLVRHGRGAAGVEIQIHPVWEPDPWATPAAAADEQPAPAPRSSPTH